MITAITLLLIFFIGLLILTYSHSVLLNSKINLLHVFVVCMISLILMLMLVLDKYAQAQAKSDFMNRLCGIDITPLTVIYYPDLANTELDFCLDTGGQPNP